LVLNLILHILSIHVNSCLPVGAQNRRLPLAALYLP
jgi:hypothetical protein